MSRHVFHQIYLHLTWHTNHNLPLLRGDVETNAYAVLDRRCVLMDGVTLHAIGGTEDHVHLVVNIEPKVCISKLVQYLKGASSHNTNEATNADPLYWQRGYGVLSFGKRHLPWVVAYVARQKEHHGTGTTHARLERCGMAE